MPIRAHSSRRLSIALLTVALASWPRFGLAQQDTTAVQDTVGVWVASDTALVQDTAQVQAAHPQDSPGDRGFVIITSDERASLRIRGSLRVNGIYDFRGLQDADHFNTFLIPVGDANIADPRFLLSANQTRLGIEVLTDSRLGEIFLRIESDFLGEGNTLRLRHAYGILEGFLVGQTWSTFGDVSSLPLTVDLDGPPSSVAARTVQVRYTLDASASWQLAVAAEAPEPQIALVDSVLEPAAQATPDFNARARLDGDFGHLQLAGSFLTINVKDSSGELQVLPGYGALLSGLIALSAKDELLFQLVGGAGISRFISALDGQGLDLVFNPITQKFETLKSVGGYVSYEHEWRQNLFSYLTVGAIHVAEEDFAPPDAFAQSEYASANAFWNATAGTRMGLEFSVGRRENVNGEDGTATRLSFIMYFDF